MPNNKLVIRDFNANDIVRIVEIEQQAHINPWSEAFFTQQLERSARAIVGELYGETIAYLIYHQVLDEAEILNLVTSKNRQKQGFASMLLNELLSRLESAQVKQVHLEVAQDNYSAIALYTKNQFKSKGRRKNYYHRKPGSCDAIIMSREVNE